MITLLGTAFVVAGIGVWVWTVKSFLDDPGYGGFDMSTAPAFDFGWFKGTVSLAIGVGVLRHSWVFGIATFLAGFVAVMVVKPILSAIATRHIANASQTSGDIQRPTGIKALSLAERDVKADQVQDLEKTGSDSQLKNGD